MESFKPEIQVPAQSYRSNLSVVNFINAYFQVRDCLTFGPENVLIIGAGIGIEPAFLRHLGMQVTVVDLDPELRPDVVGSVEDLSGFDDMQFDVVICSHVLEHLPFECFESTLSEISRVGKNALIFLPIACLVPELSIGILPLFKKIFRIPVPFSWKKHLFNGEHYWELGTKGYSKSVVRARINDFFDILDEYHNPQWHYSYNFILKSKS